MIGERTRPTAVAGTFYPASPSSLQRTVEEMLQEVPTASQKHVCPKALIVPHAGYVYSGLTAAYGYAQVQPFRDEIETVVLLGPSHRVYIHGLAVPESDSFDTPLGPVDVDINLREEMAGLEGMEIREDAHAQEHSLEVQLPFLKVALPEAKVLPIVAGLAKPELAQRVLKLALDRPKVLLVISSDLSHYLTYEESKKKDKSTVDRIMNMDGPIHPEAACGGIGISGLIALAKERQWHPELLDLRNSGDTAGDKDRVVGYSSIAFYESS